MGKIIIKFLSHDINKTDEENRTFRVGIFSTLLLEIGIIFTLFKDKNDSSIKFLLLAIFVAIIGILMLISIRLYDTYIFLRANYILYTVKKGDNLLSISEQFLPECNPWRTSEIIKSKNNIEEVLYPGQKILIPSKGKFFI